MFHNCGKVVDTRADLWSLGCVVYQLLSGETPFKTSRETREAREAGGEVVTRSIFFTHPHNTPPGL